VLMPFGAYVAARLNAEHGSEYNFHPILDWTFNGTQAQDGRYGWGVMNERWGDFDVHGLQGSWAHDGGFAFLMNTFDMAWPLVPLVRYDPRYAETIGKWMLNAANAARLFYPNQIPDQHQFLPHKKNLSRNLIAYEGVKKTDHFKSERLKGVSPVALGDGPLWIEGNPDVSQFSIYGSAHAGIFGAIIQRTNVDRILKLNCLATDFYRNPAYPTYLVYNPYDQEKTISWQHQGGEIHLYDAITKKILVSNVTTPADIVIPAGKARLIVEIPSQARVWKKNGITYADDIIINYR
jgi:hypothetical protein